MDWTPVDAWLRAVPGPLLGAIVLASLMLAAVLGYLLRAVASIGRRDPGADGQEGYIVSAVLGLLALLMGFTFALAVDRFEARRALVLEEANAIGTTYLRAQLLNEPHRQRISGLLVRYVDNRLALAKAGPGQFGDLLAMNDQIITDLWAGTVAAFPDIKGLDFSSAFIESMNTTIDLDASRKAARQARVPTEVFAVLGIYLVVTAAVLGYVLTGFRGRAAAVFLLLLLSMSLMLIIDIDRPTQGGIRETQGPMEALRKSMIDQPPAVFDKWLPKQAPAAALE